MLTKSEKKWMENRGKFSCWYCPDIPQAMCTMGERPAHCAIMDTDWQDAAEFSERVAARLAEEHEKIMLNAGFCDACFAWDICSDGFNKNDNAHCAFEMLKAARLQVEEEMDDEQKP